MMKKEDEILQEILGILVMQYPIDPRFQSEILIRGLAFIAYKTQDMEKLIEEDKELLEKYKIQMIANGKREC